MGTESYMMLPGASVSALVFAHPEAKYFSVGQVNKDQVEAYAARRGESSIEGTERWLGPMKLSDDLADIVGTKEASRAQCIKELWAYLKRHNLQDPENKQFFTPDKKMAKVFGTEK